DKGNNSRDNLHRLARTPYHVIGSLVPSQHPELLAIPLRRFRRLSQQFGRTWGYRTTKEVFGRPWALVVTRSPSLLRGQLRGIRQHLAKKLKALAELQDKLAKSQAPGGRGKAYTEASVTQHLQEITGGQYVRDILRATVRRRRGRLVLDYCWDPAAFGKLRREGLGKPILFTDNPDWSQ